YGPHQQSPRDSADRHQRWPPGSRIRVTGVPGAGDVRQSALCAHLAVQTPGRAGHHGIKDGDWIAVRVQETWDRKAKAEDDLLLTGGAGYDAAFLRLPWLG